MPSSSSCGPRSRRRSHGSTEPEIPTATAFSSPIALAEVQGYVYCAKQVLARCAERLGWSERAQRLKAEADQLAERFDASFWCPELGTYALALDGEKEPCRVRSSNAGQVLFTGIAKPDRAIEV